MKIFKILILVLFISQFYGITFSQYSDNRSYGSIFVEKGDAVVVRKNERLKFKQNQSEEVFIGDLVIVGENSKVKIDSREKASIYVGSNGIFKIREWKTDKKKGVFRFFYGKFKAFISGLRNDEEFNVRASKSVIGVKGTTYSVMVDRDGRSLFYPEESQNTMEFQGVIGDPLQVNPGEVAYTTPRGLARKIENPQASLKENLQNLDSVRLTTDQEPTGQEVDDSTVEQLIGEEDYVEETEEELATVVEQKDEVIEEKVGLEEVEDLIDLQAIDPQDANSGHESNKDINIEIDFNK